MEPITFGDINDARKFIEKYDEVQNFKYSGQENFVTQYISENYPGIVDFDDGLIRKGYFDIECKFEDGFPEPSLANQEITAITIEYKNQYIVLGRKDYTPSNGAIYKKFKEEKDLLLAFIAIMEKYKFDILSGYNIEMFDIPYIINRIKNVLGESYAKRLSPWGIIKQKTVPTLRGMEIDTYDIMGVAVLDYLLLYKKFSGKVLESYKLDYVAHEELGEGKLDYSEYRNLNELYEKDYQTYLDYNVKDVSLLLKIEAKNNLMKLATYLAYRSKANFSDIFKNTRLWDSILYNYLLERDIIVPQRKKSSKKEQFAGGYVKETDGGMANYVVTLDATSLYPSIYMGTNIGPDTYAGKVPLRIQKMPDNKVLMPDLINLVPHGHEDKIYRENLSMAANGTLYRKDKKSFMSKLLSELFAERKAAKSQMLDHEKYIEKNKSIIDKADREKIESEISTLNIKQGTIKILMNSLFGASGNPGFRFFEVEQAEAITITGQHAIQYTERKVNEYFQKMFKNTKQYVLYCDTDSVIITLEDLVQKYLPGETDMIKINAFVTKFIEQKLQPYVNKAFDEVLKYFNSYENKLFFKQEKFTTRYIQTTKKRYIMNVISSEGVIYKEPKIVIKGLEAVRSSTPEICRNSLKSAFKYLLTDTKEATQKFCSEFKEEFMKAPIQDISSPKGVNGLSKYSDKISIYTKGTPIHVRAALLYNKMLIDKKLLHKYNLIKEGSKIKYIYLKMPNPLFENIIAFDTVLPEEFGLHDFIDKDLQYEKVFEDPLDAVFNAMGCRLKESASLEDYF